jgi:hypothetical protein
MPDEQNTDNGKDAYLRRRIAAWSNNLVAEACDEAAETLTWQLSDEERADWFAFAESSGETLEQTIRRLVRRAIRERADFDRRDLP